MLSTCMTTEMLLSAKTRAANSDPRKDSRLYLLMMHQNPVFMNAAEKNVLTDD